MADKKLHSAGIFSDMTVDGPEIGTLVVIVDRAKNLPNRKSIGKQDPYCAARLGKEAKKTETDKRGGQTPRWDQEMRFTVHDSPDYYQLKVSVFNDDKKTDLISETWIALKDIIVQGGGKSDKWHNLQFKGKYAGEVRMEMTYYDSRPKPEVASKDRVREGTPSNADGSRDAASGPRVMKERVKRRPLPVDPVTGERPVQPAEAPIERYGPREPRQKTAPAEVPLRQASPQRRGYANGGAEYQQQPQQQAPPQPQSQRGYPAASQEKIYREQQQQQQQQPYAVPEPAQPQMPPQPQRSYGAPEHSRQPMQHQEPPYIHNQSPLQQVEYQAPQHARSQSHQVQSQYAQPSMQQPAGNRHYNAPPPLNLQTSSQSLRNNEQASTSGYAQPSSADYRNQQSQPADTYNDRYDQYGQVQQDSYAQANTPNRYEDQYSRGQSEPVSSQTPQHTYIIPQHDTPPSPGGPPPPPPVHRVMHSVNTAASSPGYGYNPPMPMKDQFEHLRQNAHRQSLPAFNSNTSSYNNYTPPQQTFAPQPHQPSPPKPAFVEPSNYDEPPRPRSHDERYTAQYSSMQPTVEDAPPTPSPFNAPSHHRPTIEQVQQPVAEPRYEDVAAPAPLNLGRRPSAISINNDYQTPPVVQPKPMYGQQPNSYQANDLRQPDQYREPPQPVQQYPTQRDELPQQTYSQESYRSRSPAPEPQRWQQQEEVNERPGSSGYMPSLPPTLVAGMDPAIAAEISERIYSETRRQRQAQPNAYHQDNYARDAVQRYAEASQQQVYRPTSRGRDTGSYAPSSYAPQPRGNTAYAGINKTRAVSPAPSPINSYGNPPSHQHTIVRKSVSPRPPPSRGSDDNQERRLSAVPFGPDDYAALNPNAPAVAEAVNAIEDPDAKIIMHDGREVDPSDHLPEASWAALPPNLKKSFDNPTSRDTRERPNAVSPAVQARMERRARERPHSMAGDSYGRELPPAAAGRTRLVKKANRMSTQSVSAGASPMSGGGYGNSYSNADYASRGLPRARTFDANNERVDPYDREREIYGPGGRGPPLPAKIPLPHMHSAPAAPSAQQMAPAPPVMGMGGVSSGGGRDPNEAAWTLLDEMKSIDLGTGRGRRGRNALA